MARRSKKKGAGEKSKKVATLLETHYADTDPEVWAGILDELWELKPPDLWEKIIALTDPELTVYGDGRIEGAARLPTYNGPLPRIRCRD